MPVRFQGKSEYDRKFPWRSSYRSASFTPEPEQLQTFAGLASSQIGNVTEPPIQRKKRIGPSDKTETIASLDSENVANANEYMLLGNQTKFANNIQYKVRPSDVRRSLQENGARRDESPPRSPPPAPRNPPPPPKVVVDTGAPKPRSRPRREASPVRDQSTNTSARPGPKPQPRHQHNQQHKQAEPKPQKYQTSKPVRVVEQQHRAQTQHTGQPKSAMKTQTRVSPQRPKHSGKEPQKRAEKRQGGFNEYTQTNMEKGISHSAQEAQRDYAMKYKAGIAPARMRGPKRLSEYQLQFKWKDGMKQSPLLAAEQVVYKSNPGVPPNRPARMNKSSEYRKSFKEWQMVPVPKGDEQSAPKKLKRSKSLEDVTPDRLRPAGITKVTTDEDKRLVSGSQNTLKLHFPHGRLRNYASEYAMNFKPPQKFEYEEGAWKGADPPHIEPKQVEVEVEDDDSPTTWYREVQELRAKANEYKKRAQGTHFAREHLVQLYAKQAEMWDTVSNSDTLSALDLELEGGQRTPPKPKKAAGGKKKKRVAKQAWDDDRVSTISGRSSRTLTPHGSISAISEATLSEAGMYVNYEVESVSDGGRVPTPKMRAYQPVIRHHLDRTTPSVGGALLVSPNAKAGPGSSRSGSQMSQDSEEYEYEVVKKTPTKTKKQKKSSGGSVHSEPGPRTSASAPAKINVPTYGMATRDSHVLVDDEASIDRPLQTSFVHTPEKDKVRRARQKFPNVDIPDTIQEDGGATYNRTKQSSAAQWEVKLDDIPNRNGVEDDILSMSARSVASSGSLASLTLEKARQRRDEFWSTSSIASYQ